jgi:hypothetical protein
MVHENNNLGECDTVLADPSVLKRSRSAVTSNSIQSGSSNTASGTMMARLSCLHASIRYIIIRYILDSVILEISVIGQWRLELK